MELQLKLKVNSLSRKSIILSLNVTLSLLETIVKEEIIKNIKIFIFIFLLNKTQKQFLRNSIYLHNWHWHLRNVYRESKCVVKIGKVILQKNIVLHLLSRAT
jgi:hypothetical protein